MFIDAKGRAVIGVGCPLAVLTRRKAVEPGRRSCEGRQFHKRDILSRAAWWSLRTVLPNSLAVVSMHPIPEASGFCAIEHVRAER